MNCLNCNKETKNPKFCNKSCSATYNNYKYPKRFWTCKSCNEQKIRPSRRASICHECKIQTFNTHCTSCQQPLISVYKKQLGRNLQCKMCMNIKSYKKQKERRMYRKQKLIEMFGGGCEVCGYNKNAAALAFHHKNPKTKSFMLGCHEIGCRTWDAIVEEANKCQLLCQNCHHELHYPYQKL